MKSRKKHLYKMVISALLLAIGLYLPFLLGQVEVLGQTVSPLHIPALLCGVTCGWGWGTVLGAVLPLLRTLIFGMPPMPTALPMAFELAAYGAVSGFLYPLLVRIFRKNNHLPALLCALIGAMLFGRILGGAAKACIMGFQGSLYTLEAFVAAYFTSTAAGTLIHLVVVPAVTAALEKARLSPMWMK